MAGKLTARQRIFVDAFLGVSRGNATDAARRAGCKGNTARVTSVRWLAKANVQKAIAERRTKRELATEITNERLDAILINMAEDELLEPRDRRGAVAELNKVKGRHSLNVNVSQREPWAVVLTNTRKAMLERNKSGKGGH